MNRLIEDNRPARVVELFDGITSEHIGWMFRCPGCQMYHQFHESKGWTFNGDTERPTVGGSVLVQGGSDNIRCHSFITDGRIEFLSDCTHSLVGQTVDLPIWNPSPVIPDTKEEDQ